MTGDNSYNYDNMIETLMRDMDKIKDTTKDINNRLIVVEQSDRTAHKRIDNFEKHTEAIIVMGVNIEALTTTIEELVNRVKVLELAPGKAALKGWIWVLCTIGAAGIGIILGKLI